MVKKKIALIEPSDIISQGIGTILKSKSYKYEIEYARDSFEMKGLLKNGLPDLMIINPSVFINSQADDLKSIRQEAIKGGFKILALVYYFLDQNISGSFDDVIYINDSADEVFKKLDNFLFNNENTDDNEGNQPLSQRELDVVKCVALGCSNREIADELHISIHTVISHRKNITSKLGIKSTSGLTIYAIINKLINSNDLEKTIK